MTKLHDYQGKAVLITGGTRGLGLACGLAFGRRGAHVYLTHRWGSADEGELRAAFAAAGAPEPTIVEADASRDADTAALIDRIAEAHDGVEAFVSNVCVVMRPGGVEDHRCRALLQTLEYSSWPLLGYLHAMKKRFDRYPRYVVAMSSDGADSHYPGYDYVAVAKAVLENMVRYTAVHLREDGVRINALRTRQVITGGYTEMFGDDRVDLAARFPELMITPEEVANTVYALCSGLLDAVSGQVITADRGAGFIDNIMTLGPRLHDGAGEVA